MNIKELKIAISKLPDDMEVYVPSQTGDFDYGRAFSVSKNIIDDEDLGTVDACIIDEK